MTTVHDSTSETSARPQNGCLIVKMLGEGAACATCSLNAAAEDGKRRRTLVPPCIAVGAGSVVVIAGFVVELLVNYPR